MEGCIRSARGRASPCSSTPWAAVGFASRCRATDPNAAVARGAGSAGHQHRARPRQPASPALGRCGPGPFGSQLGSEAASQSAEWQTFPAICAFPNHRAIISSARTHPCLRTSMDANSGFGIAKSCISLRRFSGFAAWCALSAERKSWWAIQPFQFSGPFFLPLCRGNFSQKWVGAPNQQLKPEGTPPQLQPASQYHFPSHHLPAGHGNGGSSVNEVGSSR